MNTINLGGKWNLKKADNTINIEAKVPGDVYADLMREKIILHCDGLDTFSRLIINHTIIDETDNMFRTYEWNVKDFLIEGQNSIEIYFKSTIPYAKGKQAEHPLYCWGAFTGYDENWVLRKSHKVDVRAAVEKGTM